MGGRAGSGLGGRNVSDIGGPLDGKRYQAPRASGFTLAAHGAEDFEYRAVEVMFHDGPVTFWVPAGISMGEICQKLLAGIPSACLSWQ